MKVMENLKDKWYALSDTTRANIKFISLIIILLTTAILSILSIEIVFIFSGIVIILLFSYCTYLFYGLIKDICEEDRIRYLEKKKRKEWIKKQNHENKTN